ncbi:hypothetical protein I79_014221 [Cricetulus griseus]|uniref:Uncharacterized protein n=1 Tax=Cricetulus griseus TaxID=10029 RepID=G3HTJ4_CRIGR|nr:hypothetical protein I79_014221 [Cricetulus griseus]
MATHSQMPISTLFLLCPYLIPYKGTFHMPIVPIVSSPPSFSFIYASADFLLGRPFSF